MMDEAKARELGQRFLDGIGSGFRTTGAESFERCWIVLWELADARGPLPPGSAPLLVDRADQSVHRIGSAPGYEAWAHYYDRYGKLGSASEIMQLSLGSR